MSNKIFHANMLLHCIFGNSISGKSILHELDYINFDMYIINSDQYQERSTPLWVSFICSLLVAMKQLVFQQQFSRFNKTMFESIGLFYIQHASIY